MPADFLPDALRESLTLQDFESRNRHIRHIFARPDPPTVPETTTMTEAELHDLLLLARKPERADPETIAYARAELLLSLAEVLDAPQPLTRARLEKWELIGNAMREYLRAEDLQVRESGEHPNAVPESTTVLQAIAASVTSDAEESEGTVTPELAAVLFPNDPSSESGS